MTIKKKNTLKDLFRKSNEFELVSYLTEVVILMPSWKINWNVNPYKASNILSTLSVGIRKGLWEPQNLQKNDIFLEGKKQAKKSGTPAY